MRTKALDEGNCAAARPGGFRGEADKTGREASRNKKLESKRRAHEQFRAEGDIPTSEARKATGCEAGDADELAPHSEVRVSASEGIRLFSACFAYSEVQF
jgi:hypothetical protein